MVQPIAIKNCIIEACKPHIGFYQYPGGYTDYAICVGSVADDVVVNGLEFRIPIYPIIAKGFRAGDAYHHQIEKWHIDVIQRDGNKTNYFQAVDRLMQYFVNYVDFVDIPRQHPSFSYNQGQLTVCVPCLTLRNYNTFEVTPYTP